MRIFIKIFIMYFLFYFGFLSSSYALEVTAFNASRVAFTITVALDDLDNSRKVSCVIYSDGKPIAKGSQRINGVGTMFISNDARITEGITAKCK